MKLRQNLFWDTDVNKLDPEIHAKQIVPRIFMRGEIEEIKEAMRFYGEEEIKAILTETRYLDRQTLSFCVAVFNIPKEVFRCYKLSQSMPQLWDY